MSVSIRLICAFQRGMEMSLGIGSSLFERRYPRGVVLPLDTNKDARRPHQRPGEEEINGLRESNIIYKASEQL